jgi:hypothetical protein
MAATAADLRKKDLMAATVFIEKRSSTVKSGSMAALFFRVSKGKERRRCWGIYRDFISCETSKDRARTGDFGG